jgi:hypothetical protein
MLHGSILPEPSGLRRDQLWGVVLEPSSARPGNLFTHLAASARRQVARGELTYLRPSTGGSTGRSRALRALLDVGHPDDANPENVIARVAFHLVPADAPRLEDSFQIGALDSGSVRFAARAFNLFHTDGGVKKQVNAGCLAVLRNSISLRRKLMKILRNSTSQTTSKPRSFVAYKKGAVAEPKICGQDRSGPFCVASRWSTWRATPLFPWLHPGFTPLSSSARNGERMRGIGLPRALAWWFRLAHTTATRRRGFHQPTSAPLLPNRRDLIWIR